MPSDYTIAICDHCRIAVPIDTADRAAWDVTHLHDEEEL